MEPTDSNIDNGIDATENDMAPAAAELGASPDRRMLALFFLLTLAGYLCQPNYDPEFFQHLTIGRQISSLSATPSEYLWSPLAAGKDWSPPAVFFDAALGWVFANGGFSKLLSLKLALYVASVFLMCWAFQRASGDRFFGGVIATVVASGVLVRGDFTPHHPGLAGFLIVLLLLLEPIERRYFAAAALTGLILFLAGLCPAAAFMSLAAVMLAGFSRNKFPAARASVIPAAGLTAAAALLTPLGASLAAEVRDRVSQFLHLAEFYGQPIQFDYAGAALLLIAVFGLILGAGPQGPKSRWCLIALLFPAAVPGLHFLLSYAAAAAAFQVCLIWRDYPAARLSPTGVGLELLKNKLSRTPEPGSSFLLVCLLIVNTFSLYQTPSVFVGMPVQEADRILKKKYSGPVLTEAPAAGYLNYKFTQGPAAPQPTVFAAEADLSFDAGAALAAADAIRGKPGWEKTLAAAAPGVILIRTSRPLAVLLSAEAKKPDSIWRLDSTGGRPLDAAVAAEELPTDLQPVVDWSLFVRR